jgi:hypothetical protein
MRANTPDRFLELAQAALQRVLTAEQLLAVGIRSRQLNEAAG